MKEASISLYLDTRRKLREGNYPVKLRVYFGKAVLYDTGLSLTEEEYEHAYQQPSPRGRFKKIQTELKSVEATAMTVIKELRTFSFDKFEKKLFRNKSSVNNVIAHYQEYIEELRVANRIGTKISYECSLKSIKSFMNEGRKNPVSQIAFEKINPDFLNKYERWMLSKGNSRTTIGIYLRPLRRIFNLAMENSDVDPELYPFKSYKIPTGRNTKKNLDTEILKTLFNAELEPGSFQEKARDFWFFSYQCNGMNFRDIAELKNKDFNETYFSFLRHKTINTTKENPKPIIVPITSTVKSFIEKYGTNSNNPNDYVFPIFTRGMSAEEQYRANSNFIRFVNQHMKRLADSKGIKLKLGTMYARHSFTTRVTRELGLEFAQEALGHTTLSTTQNYWAGFEQDTKKQMAEKLLDFK